MHRFAVILLALAACHATPRPCFEPAPERRPPLPAPPDGFDGVPDELVPHAAAPIGPTAPLRVGDATSRPAIAQARHALGESSCAQARAAVAGLRADHHDHDYLAYLDAWCEVVHGNPEGIAALAVLTATTLDPELAPFVRRELLALLATTTTPLASARDLLVAHHLWPETADAYAAALVRAGRPHPARLVIAELADAPESADLLCRQVVAECRAELRRPTGHALPACNPPTHRDESPTCTAWRTRARVQAVLASTGPTSPELAALAREVHDQAPDRIDLVLVASRWPSAAPTDLDAARWPSIADAATELAHRAQDPGVRAAAEALAATARRNAEPPRCPR